MKNITEIGSCSMWGTGKIPINISKNEHIKIIAGPSFSLKFIINPIEKINKRIPKSINPLLNRSGDELAAPKSLIAFLVQLNH